MKRQTFLLAVAAIVACSFALLWLFSQRAAPPDNRAPREAVAGSTSIVEMLRELAKTIPETRNEADGQQVALPAMKIVSQLEVDSLSLDIRKRMVGENFFLDGIFTVASSLAISNVSEDEMSDWLMIGWERYRDLCWSFETIASTYSDAEKRMSRELSSKARMLYANDYRLMDSLLIGLLFADMPDGAAERFRAKWKAAFAEPDACGR